MKIPQKDYQIRNIHYIIRSVKETDAINLSEVRLKIDGETENLDREPGEAYIDEAGFQQLIRNDTESDRNLFLVVEANGKIVGFSRCEGYNLTRKAHQVEFGVGVLKEYWGYGMGKNLLAQSIQWADANHFKKMTLSVLETNEKAISLYQKLGFEVEGVLKQDKLLSDGHFYNTILMGRIKADE
ncbi:GNAT family N-acetyltransferase [Bacillus sp. JJ1764]|uniref:GNAT family N-acetyltransferase n=1 Tax=Bacillus sp. JJ1764 TaxID=3122964 RepID=UPI003000BCFE